MVTSFAKSMNTHIAFSPVFKVKNKHSIEKIMFHMLLHKSPTIKICVRRPATVFSVDLCDVLQHILG